MTEDQRGFEEKIAIIDARKESFLKSPICFTVWDLTQKFFNICFWLGFWLLMAQCNCQCIIN